jgi:primosomal protein N' (replication factor Y)
MARLHYWLAAQSGEADIVVGTRLSVFTPMPRLGLIVIDEEHDSSFKQQDGVRYSARDVAIFRASGLQCPIVLGSATPSIETIANASRGKFTRLKLQKRAVANAELPKVNFIHLDSEKAPHGLTGSLIDQLRVTLARGEQAMVFINRRGYSPALVCGTCGWMPECTRCSARMVFHRAINKLKCHHCGFERRAPSVCGHCGSDDLRAAGQGSERIEDALFEALPGARIARVDRDATRLKGSAEKIFADAAAGNIDILVGTQMLAKGHDFPRLTLVGVVNADGAVFSADFRAAERMAQLLMQVAGRAGRAALPGRVLIQTRFPEHPVYQAVAGHEYAGFVAAALGERKLMQLPPYSYLALLKAESKDEAKLDLFLTQAQAAAAVALKELSQSEPDCDVRVWEPVAATLARKAGYMRKQLMLQSAHRSVLQLFLTRWMADIRSMPARQVKWVIDVDPIEL